MNIPIVRKSVIQTMNTQEIFAEGVRRTNGKLARRYNLIAARLVVEIVKNSFGPGGLEKLFTDVLGEVTITKDGATILRKIDVQHPAANVIIEASNAVDNEVGDGTIAVVVLAGALAEKAEILLDMGTSPQAIVDGYAKSLEITLDALWEFSQVYKNTDREILSKLARTCLQSKLTLYSLDNISKLIVDAVCTVADYSSNSIEIDDIKIESKIGNLSDTELVTGIVIDKTIDSDEMPRSIQNAKIILIDDELEGERTRTEAEIQILSPNQMNSYKEHERLMIKSKIKHIVDSGANVVISRKGINTFAQNLLARAGIISVRRVKENDLLWLEKATGASISEKLSHGEFGQSYAHDHDQSVTHSHRTNHQQNNAPQLYHDNHNYHHGDIEIKLGYAERVYEAFVGDDRMVFIQGCRDPKAITLLLRANSKEILAELHRSVLDGINVLKDFVTEPAVVTGGGSIEMAIARVLREHASMNATREQLVMQKFSEALEEIPITIARNAGMNVIDTIAELRFKHSKRTQEAKSYGIDAIGRKVKMLQLKVIEPSLVKEQIIKTAVEVTNLLVRVDDVLMAKPVIFTHTHADGTEHSHADGHKIHQHDYFDKLGKQQRPTHHFY